MRTADEWFNLYGESHKNKINKLIHWICIPVILMTTLGLVQTIPHPFGDTTWLHWGSIAAALCLVFYARLSLTLAAGMGVVSIVALSANAAIVAAGYDLLTVSISVFFIAWVFQFIGHKIEGKKPSFFQDLQFLLVGPAWLLQFVFRAVGIPVTSADRKPVEA